MQAITERIEALEPRLRGIARRYAGLGNEPDDLFQDMAGAILAQARVAPDFVDQTDAYILQFARWEAMHIVERQVTYLRYVDSAEDALKPPPGDYAEAEVLLIEDTIPDNSPNLERDLEQRQAYETLARMVGELEPSNQKIITMLYQGYSKREIARSLNITPQALNSRIKHKGIYNALKGWAAVNL